MSDQNNLQPRIFTPLDMLIRVFAVADLLEKAQSEKEEKRQQTLKKTQNNQAIVS